MKSKVLIPLLLLFQFLFLVFSVNLFSQSIESAEITGLIQSFKKDERGPYQAIRWFCPDGTIIPPKERCPEPGGIQHALHKDIVTRIAKNNGIYLGQILAGAKFEDVLDEVNRNSRLKQYMMERYLQRSDDGWIFRRARYYRGAIQVEDEEYWGVNFLKWIVSREDIIDRQFYLLRQAAKDIPHKANDNHWNNIRDLSKTLGDSLPSFMDLRVKLHGQPDMGDLERVRNFKIRNKNKIPVMMDELLQNLEKELELAFKPTDLQTLSAYIEKLPSSNILSVRTKKLITAYGRKSSQNNPDNRIKDIASLLWEIRANLLSVSKPDQRLAIIDLSNELETILFSEIRLWKPETIGGLLEKNYYLTKAAAGCGFLEKWEWEQIEQLLSVSGSAEDMSLDDFRKKSETSRRAVEWSAGMVRANFEPVVSLFDAFEPLAKGFTDDRIRGSVLLPLGEVAGDLSDRLSVFAGQSNNVMGISNQNKITGLNPGFAFGKLEVVPGAPDDIQFAADKIYILMRPPADMKPVAGIATVSEGNLVSHVQLLARNLGIPNAVLSDQNLADLSAYSGKEVFYAVSPGGSVLMKPAEKMTDKEKALIQIKKRKEERIKVPTGKIDLNQTDILNLRKLRASDSGKICGPKAANLGQLKSMFPQRVVEGLVIPFGIFRQHMDQFMPGSELTYWQYLQETFENASGENKTGMTNDQIDSMVLKRLEVLREAIRKIKFSQEFLQKMKAGFADVLGRDMGRVPVFIRSDTNMEDLKDFTGAGLNLTVFNVVDEEKILQAIRDVWASPFTERSYKWRQKFLLNPENVYPSILIIPTVDVEKSGVMITTGVTSGNPEDVTIAFNRGAGGAVEGQAAESYLLRIDGTNQLLSPSRETLSTTLPATGGTAKAIMPLNKPVLDNNELNMLRAFAGEIKKNLPGTPGIESKGPFDVELGFKDGQIWLFQVRPFVENKNARSSEYLQKMDPKIKNIRISLTDTLN